jgi:CP family cyanate transporter-like MFS transporter
VETQTDVKELQKPQDRSRLKTILLIIGIVLLAANLRASITAVGPLIGEIRATTGISSLLSGLITTLPLLAFGFLSTLAPRIARRWGIETTLLGSLVVLVVGIVLRAVPVVSLLFVGTALLGMAIALGNVLLPSLIKREFPLQVGLMTGVYTTVMGVGAALASGVSIPLAQGVGLGWRGSLLFWALPAAIALAVWLLLLRVFPNRVLVRVGEASRRGLWSSSLAWRVTLFMGLQSLAYYVMVAWLPEILRSRGVSLVTAGWMFSLLQFVSVLSSFFVSLLAGRFRSQRALVALTMLLCLIAYAGFLSGANELIPLWCVLLGLGQGACLSLALMFFILRTTDARSAAELSGMAQSIGYFLAALGPILFGGLHDLTHGWSIPLAILIIVTLILLGIGLSAGRDVTVGD